MEYTGGVDVKVNTYKEMNEKIKDILRTGDSPECLYAAQRIEELEKENIKLEVELININQRILSEIF